MPAPGGDSRDAACQPDDVDRRRAVDGRPVADLAAVVPPPALHAAGARERAGVCDGDDPAARREHVDGRQPVGAAPALDAALCRHRTVRGHGGHAAAQADDVDRRRTVDGGAVAEVPEAVGAPALDPTRASERAAAVTPPAIAFTPLLRPTTSTGARPSVAVPSPSWPRSAMPQHLTPPAVVSAHVCRSPAANAATPVRRPDTSTGTELATRPSARCRAGPRRCSPSI